MVGAGVEINSVEAEVKHCGFDLANGNAGTKQVLRGFGIKQPERGLKRDIPSCLAWELNDGLVNTQGSE